MSLSFAGLRLDDSVLPTSDQIIKSGLDKHYRLVFVESVKRLARLILQAKAN